MYVFHILCHNIRNIYHIHTKYKNKLKSPFNLYTWKFLSSDLKYILEYQKARSFWISFERRGAFDM